MRRDSARRCRRRPARSPRRSGRRRRRNARSSLVRALQLRDRALDRAARHELHDRERDQHDAEDRRDHQQEPAGDIGEHAASAGPRGRSGKRLSESNGLGLRFVPPPGARRAGAQFWLVLGTRKRVPIGDPGRVAIPHRNPIMAGAQDAVERAAGRVESSRDFAVAIVSTSASTTGSETPAILREAFCFADSDV